ncbi:MAG: leucine-rich repeat domain-containing protein, partial [Candidatus Poribacteria bacterium]|nr:leucine-rich repeat domain-containing protein [Candidatus Poribacteria bacterium]
IDLRDYEWDVRNDAWTQIEQAYPYKMTFDAPTQTHLREKLTILQQEMNSEVPFVHIDWFLATASLPPLYHDILALPKTDRELEAALEVFVTENLLNAPGKRVWRAGFNNSGVSRHNRVVERHISRYGAYWKSYDFAGSAESQNIFTHPLDFIHDGGEIIFNLPNGLQAYYLVDGEGNRLDVAPTDIVSNPAVSDPAVRNGLSCIGCHTEGMKTFEDEVRAVVEQADNPPFNKDRALNLYVERAVMADLVAEDTQRYRTALEAAGGVFGGIEPIQRFHEAFQGPLSASHAAASVGLETDVFLEKISKNVSLQNLLGVLVVESGTLKRDNWTYHFEKVLSLLNTSDTILPPVEQRPERIPGAADGVHIPDQNLRTAIQEALGKAPNDLITVEEVETLTSLRASHRDIFDLEGIQFAKNLDELWLSVLMTPDLSPLAGLVNLTRLFFHGVPSFTDLSPLSGLLNLRSLIIYQFTATGRELGQTDDRRRHNIDISPLEGLTELRTLWVRLSNGTETTDISPLANLTKLSNLKLDGHRISDLLPLANLTNLRSLDLGQNFISDISPLVNLTNLIDLKLDRNNISDLFPLSNLTNLTILDLDYNGDYNGNVRIPTISDISPLANLRHLSTLHLSSNNISDISSLADLGRLERLYLSAGNISDISSLANLRHLSTLHLSSNNISNVSPLANLQYLKELHLDSNNISDISPLADLQHLEVLRLQHNAISDISPLDALRERTDKVTWHGNPCFPQPAPRIEGPWLWGVVPGTNFHSNKDVDHLSLATDGAVTELDVATNGAIVGNPIVGEHVWTSHKYYLAYDEFGYTKDYPRMLETLKLRVSRDSRVVYGTVTLNSPREQKTNMLAGSEKAHKVWLNGELVRDWKFNYSGERLFYNYSPSDTYNDFFPVTLKPGRNVLLIALYLQNTYWDFIGSFGFEHGTEYTLSEGIGYAFSQDKINVGDTFTFTLTAENITDLAGWQADISFNPEMLEVVEVTEGDFLKSEGGNTFFHGGAIDNAQGKITGMFSAKQSESGVSGSGILLSVTFKAKLRGETQAMLENFAFGASTGETIPIVPPNIMITVDEVEEVEIHHPAWDVNQDGRVSILDLILVAQDFGSGTPANLRTDVNRDGVINVQDLILVENHFGESTDSAASPLFAIDNKELLPAMVQAWIDQAQAENDGSLVFRQGIKNLERLLASLIPEKTALLANYPNPFNPETWIPYHLAKPADVSLTIYAANGAVVRTLVLGHQAAGIYQSRSRAAHWDGRNSVGESVASGIYFYMLTAGDFTATRKMLILK